MHWYDAFLFSAQVGGRSSLAYLWALVLVLFSFIVIGLVWGLLWNRKWGFSNHLGVAGLNFVLAVITGVLALAWVGADRSLGWLDAERESIGRALSESGSLNREAMRDAWEKLSPLGKQNDLTSPTEGGNELRLSSTEDAKTLAGSSAAVVKRHLSTLAPYSFGLNCFVRDPAAVADDVVAAVETPNYPVVVRPDNAWTKAAVVSQVGSAFDVTQRSARGAIDGLKLALLFTIAAVLAIQMITTAALALSDIQVNPQVERNFARA